MVTIRWKFRNGHEWERTFDTEPEARNYWHLCALATDPNIIRVWINDKPMRES